MATKVLNLDEIETGNEKSVVLNGKEYFMKPPTVGEFIDQVKRLEGADEVTSSEAFELIVELVSKAFPGMDVAELKALEFPKLNKLYEFIRATTEEEIDAGNVSQGSQPETQSPE